jgi:DNA-binding MarR family transcriptional regulator
MTLQRHGSSDALVDELFDTTVVLRSFAENRLRPIGASVARLRALRVLALEGAPVRMRDLSEMLGIAARTTTTIVDSLEHDGLVERVRHADDRRAFLLTLTEAGSAQYEKAEAVDTQALAEATGTLTTEEREQLRTLLGKVRNAAEQA